MTSRREWRLLTLLFVLSFLNYIDRANLSVGATDIQRDLHLSSYRLGLLLSALFWTYAVLQLINISGWVVDRFNVGWRWTRQWWTRRRTPVIEVGSEVSDLATNENDERLAADAAGRSVFSPG